ncbi:MAG: hypothetical protein WCC66_08915 [Rhizobiaceae bacterium]
MTDFIFLMHALPDGIREGDWSPWLDKLTQGGYLRGGSEIGDGATFKKAGGSAPVTHHINGFVRIQANDMNEAKMLLEGNPVYEAGGTVEIRYLPQSS